MLKSHAKFHSEKGKRLLLVVDDEPVNRALLGAVLEGEYEILFAENGQQALELLHQYKDIISLVLLDLIMPVMTGLELLAKKKEDPAIQSVPVIVVTADQASEVESLQLGALDFIPKPYPQVDVILARILRIIELSEDRQIIQSTERDPLTGLYNREYFYRYAEQFDQYHKNLEMDAIVLDVNHFHTVNERYGKAYGDEVLRRIGTEIRDAVQDSGGIVSRREADTFLIYCPHRTDYKKILEGATRSAAGKESAGSRIHLRMGVYSIVDKGIDVERRFDRAKMAADAVRNSYANNLSIYDSAMQEKELYAEQLIEDFHKALQEEQFLVFYQPKFDVRPEIPVLASAEALVRWKHPRLGMISPGVFIPLFEENGLIQELDRYVWRKAAAQIRDWQDRLHFAVPVSVNVSRVDMYNSNLVTTLLNILEEYDLGSDDFLLEITESAYTQDSEQIISMVNQMREKGFKIEMDDFGTGYSSLNMLSTLPLDALKLDMKFIRTAFNRQKDTRMLELIIDIADYLSVPVIAEGVETSEQLTALRAMGCDIVQGYYFSKPVPPEEYEVFVTERKEQKDIEALKEDIFKKTKKEAFSYSSIAHALSDYFESIYYVDTITDRYIEFSSRGKYNDLQIEHSGENFFQEAQNNLNRLIYRNDLNRVLFSMQKERLLAQLARENQFSMTFRLLIEGEPVYYNLKAVSSGKKDDHHIVIGIGNVDRQMKQAIDYEDVKVKGIEFFNIAQALSQEFESIYYVNIETDEYTEYIAKGPYENLTLELSGLNFFEECQQNLEKVVWQDDRDMIREVLRKDLLLRELETEKTLFVEYHLLMNDSPVPYRMKIVKSEDTRHIVIGVSNRSAEIAQEKTIEAVMKDNVTYASIARALAADYFSIYYVNTETDHFIEYSSHHEYDVLGIEKSGDDFFAQSQENILRVVYPEDLNKIQTIFTKERIMMELVQSGIFTITYRLMIQGVPTYVRLKATRMEDKEDPHIVIGINNVDAEMRREQELGIAREKINRDALTGVKNKHAYVETEQQMNERITARQSGPFAVVVCDLNDLKEINDTLGHAAGDQHIKDACMQICHVFQHSPVFRIGGDEFAVILRGGDYEKRNALMEEMARKNREHLQNGGSIIAGGIAEYIPETDTALSAVFERADAAMYENKKQLKALREDRTLKE